MEALAPTSMSRLLELSLSPSDVLTRHLLLHPVFSSDSGQEDRSAKRGHYSCRSATIGSTCGPACGKIARRERYCRKHTRLDTPKRHLPSLTCPLSRETAPACRSGCIALLLSLRRRSAPQPSFLPRSELPAVVFSNNWICGSSSGSASTRIVSLDCIWFLFRSRFAISEVRLQRPKN
jgi:hypothetical protein